MERNVGRMRARIAKHPILSGLVLGFVWGVAIRLWMRYISTDPEFTWAGTGYIVGAATIVGTLLGFAYFRYRLAKGNWWRTAGLSVLLLGLAAGGVMIPTVILGALGLGRRNWPQWLRGLLLALAVGAQVALFAEGGVDFPRGRFVPAMVAYAVFIGLETWAASIAVLPSRNGARAADTRAQLGVDAPA